MRHSVISVEVSSVYCRPKCYIIVKKLHCLKQLVTVATSYIDELHWLDVLDRVFFKLAVIVHRCLNGRAPL